ncbi:hypothetical protein PGTUg99_031955 [Puccinia graminis f. sp. tritici]|uniref:Autophagy-related protein 13 n=2 Tax=Puccinia graminis f. sp. tritici TaxID=56615 RepID=A0A5B0SKK6_PUCGR|nr:hypothetical protein PGTUg99_031955 [Puccinia graminis f. sp. tritici]
MRRQYQDSSHSSTRNKTTKTDQLIHHIYSKSTQLIINARIDQPTSTTTTTDTTRHDKWFNLELPEPDYFKEELKTWKSLSASIHSLSNSNSSNSLKQQQPLPNYDLIPVLIFETILDIQALPPNSFITLTDSQAREHTVDHRIPQPTHPNHPTLHHQSTHSLNRPQIHKNIVIERWSVSLLGPFPNQPTTLEPPTVYRHSIIHFRALYSHLRTMPGSTLYQRLKKRTNPEHGLLKIGCRISTANPCQEFSLHPLQFHHPSSYPHQEIGIYQDLSNSQSHAPPDSISTYDFPSIQTSLGSIKTRVIYRNQIDFRIGDKERVLSSRFRQEDQLERPLRASSSSTTSTTATPISAWIVNYRAACSKFTKSGLSVPTTSTTTNRPAPHPIPSHPHNTDHHHHHQHHHQSESVSPHLKSEPNSSDHPPLTSYGSLSSRHHPVPKPHNSTSFDQLFTPVEPSKTSSDSLTAEILAATESSPFASVPHRPSQNNNGSGNSSALTAKLRQSLPPVQSNALPLPPSLNRSNSSITAAPGGNSKMGASNTAASPRQFSVLSSSPLSGPSSSIRISTGRPHSQQASSSNTAHLLPGASPTTPGGSSGSSYPPIPGPLSPVPADPSLAAQRSALPGQPMMRRYSSSRHSRSFGQASSSGGTSLLTGDSGGSLGRRALLNSSAFDELHQQRKAEEEKSDINQFIHLIDSSQTIPITLRPHPRQASRPAHLRYQKRTPKDSLRSDQPLEPSLDNLAPTIEEEQELEEDSRLSLLVKEKLELTLKKLIPPSNSEDSIPSSGLSNQALRSIPHSSHPPQVLSHLTEATRSDSSHQYPSNISSSSSNNNPTTWKGKARAGSTGPPLPPPPATPTTLQRLREEEDEDLAAEVFIRPSSIVDRHQPTAELIGPPGVGSTEQPSGVGAHVGLGGLVDRVHDGDRVCDGERRAREDGDQMDDIGLDDEDDIRVDDEGDLEDEEGDLDDEDLDRADGQANCTEEVLDGGDQQGVGGRSREDRGGGDGLESIPIELVIMNLILQCE